jgi:hypothetical protein
LCAVVGTMASPQASLVCWSPVAGCIVECTVVINVCVCGEQVHCFGFWDRNATTAFVMDALSTQGLRCLASGERFVFAVTLDGEVRRVLS